MPNTAIHRLENCFMPPKKSAWRINKAQSENTVIEDSAPGNGNSVEMGLLYESGIKSDLAYSAVERMTVEDAPLDFSLKTSSSSKSSSEIPNHGIKPVGKSDPVAGAGHTAKLAATAATVSRIFNGNSSPPVTPNEYRSPVLKDMSQVYHPLVTSSCKETDSLEMNYSESSDQDTSTETGLSGRAMSNNSPEFLRQHSPLGQKSILEGMLRGQQQQTASFPKSMHSLPTSLGLLENKVMGNSSPPMAIPGPALHPANTFLPLAVPPYFGYGYVDQNNSFLQNYMYKLPESGVMGASSARKSRRKIDPLTDSLKSSSVEELRNKLFVITGENSLLSGINNSGGWRSSWSPRRDHGESFSNNSSPELVQNAINRSDFNGKNSVAINNHKSKDINGALTQETNVALNQNEIRGTHITQVHSSDNVAHLNSNETNQRNVSETKHCESNGKDICAGDSDSVCSAIGETCNSDQKEKHIPDYKKDPMYKVKRAKNNLAARRSRETRRMKEELIRQTASALEAHNKILVRDFAALKYTVEDMQVRYIATLKENESLKIQCSIMQDRLDQKKCGECGSSLPLLN